MRPPPGSDRPRPLIEVGRLPQAGDNVAIAVRRLPAGTRVVIGEETCSLTHTILEGHRFAVIPIAAGAPLLSWGLPFGVARRSIAPGEYVVNASTLVELSGRRLDFPLPDAPNFDNWLQAYALDEAAFAPAAPLPRVVEPATFAGYHRPGGRGVGTRNAIVLLGTSAAAAPFVRRLETRLGGVAGAHDNVDAIVAVAHTEGAHQAPNNRDLLLRTLAGYIVHPNTGAVLLVDQGDEPVNNAALRAFMVDHAYPLAATRHHFLSIGDDFVGGLEVAEDIVRGWLTAVAADRRREAPLSALKVALQCGGSDAFSGVSGNPLAARVAADVIRHGGSANLAETDELAGAEAYLLARVRDLATARAFLTTLERFKAWAAGFGESIEGNPSGGNKYRGLYNITLKSIGAANKRDPKAPLDYVIDYAAPMTEPGFYFMDSPGNDLESIAGQVAAGCNLIFFVTGNGSITNFPFVPTIKIVTTTRRFDLLPAEMDVNAGAYLDGTPMARLAAETFELTRAVAGGRLTAGEKAGHAQVQIWRNWRAPAPARAEVADDGRPLPFVDDAPGDFAVAAPASIPRLGLILPTSLCSGQIARLAVEALNADPPPGAAVDRYATVVHTEGCGVSDNATDLYVRLLIGHATHPHVAHCLFLEHGCEKTHNDFFHSRLRAAGIDVSRFGWASVQLDGGIARVQARMRAWFAERDEAPDPPPAGRRLALMAAGPLDGAVAGALRSLAAGWLRAGHTVVVPAGEPLLDSAPFRAALAGRGADAARPNLACGAAPAAAGVYIMDMPATFWTERLTAVGAAGVDAVIAVVDSRAVTGHPFVPVLQVTTIGGQPPRSSVDVELDGDPAGWPARLQARLAATLAGAYTPTLARQGNLDFQLTRGLIGISM